jgi:hypothetical protein
MHIHLIHSALWVGFGKNSPSGVQDLTFFSINVSSIEFNRVQFVVDFVNIFPDETLARSNLQPFNIAVTLNLSGSKNPALLQHSRLVFVIVNFFLVY